MPDHTTASRRAIKLPSIARDVLPDGPLHVVIDSRGLKIYGTGQWLAERPGRRAPRRWRKLHLAVGAGSGQVLSVTLTDQEFDDASQVGALLDQIPGEIARVTADGAYDGEPTDATVAARGANIAVVIPPRATARAPPELAMDASHRDVQVHTVAALGRLGWQKLTGYGRRALVEATMDLYQALIGTRLRSRHEAGRRTEAAMGAVVLNRMLAAGPTNSLRVQRDTK